jgi:hypothetical protein
MELVVIGLVAGIGFASYALWHKAKKDESQARAEEQKRLMPPAERTPTTIQVGDVVQHLGRDFVVEGVVTFSEEGRGARFYRMFDDGKERFLYARGGSADPLLLAPAMVNSELDGSEPPERLEHAGGSYQKSARAQAQAVVVGQFGARSPNAKVRVFEYVGAGPLRLLIVDWGRDVEVFAGERLSPASLDILPVR